MTTTNRALKALKTAVKRPANKRAAQTRAAAYDLFNGTKGRRD